MQPHLGILPRLEFVRIINHRDVEALLVTAPMLDMGSRTNHHRPSLTHPYQR